MAPFSVEILEVGGLAKRRQREQEQTFERHLQMDF